MEKRWRVLDKENETAVKVLSTELNMRPVLAELLIHRGITNIEEARQFFRPSMKDLNSPFQMADMDKAIDRINKAVVDKQKVLVYGDYDVDGTCSVAMFYSFMRSRVRDEDRIGYYIPDRYKEGYGISTDGVQHAIDNGYSLIVALDCGITAHDKVDMANKARVDFIICDHHLPNETLPAAVAVLNPKRSDCEYPYKELTGCGIGYKLMEGVLKRMDENTGSLEKYLQYVAISTCCDIVPLTKENRTLVYFGLKKINERPFPGLRDLKYQAKIRHNRMTVSDLVFYLGPRINAAGRVAHASAAVELLISRTTNQNGESADDVEKNNIARKELDKDITEEALQMIADSEELQQAKSTVLFNSGWHKGVVGIVASRVMEKHYRPTIILTEADGKVTGSARSVKGYNVYEAINKCGDLLEQFGGHMYAAGLTMKPENVEAFQQKFEEVVAASITEEQLIPELTIDAEVSLDEIDAKFGRIIKQFAPYGPENLKPVFLAKDVVNVKYADRVGGDKTHLKMDVADMMGEKTFRSIGFSLGHWYDHVSSGEEFDIVYSVEESYFKGQTRQEVKVRDIRKPEDR